MIEIKGTDVYCPKGNTITLQFRAGLDDGTYYVFKAGDVMIFRLKNTKNSVEDIITRSTALTEGETCQEFVLECDDTDLARDNYYYTVDLVRDNIINTIVSAKFVIV